MHWAVQVVFCLFVFFIPLVSLCSVKPSWTLKESQRNPDVSSLSSYWLRLSRFFSGCTPLQLSCWFIINNSQLLFFLCITVFKVPSCLLIWQWKANTFAIAEQHCNSVNFGSSVECLIVTGHFIRYPMIAEGWKSYSLQNCLNSSWHGLSKIPERFLGNLSTFWHDSITIFQLHIHYVNLPNMLHWYFGAGNSMFSRN